MELKNNVTVGFPLVPITTLTFVVLKLTSVIDWSWWWVFSPVWISAGLVLLALAAALFWVSRR